MERIGSVQMGCLAVAFLLVMFIRKKKHINRPQSGEIWSYKKVQYEILSVSNSVRNPICRNDPQVVFTDGIFIWSVPLSTFMQRCVKES